jgi:hypothetical protein
LRACLIPELIYSALDGLIEPSTEITTTCFVPEFSPAWDVLTGSTARKMQITISGMMSLIVFVKLTLFAEANLKDHLVLPVFLLNNIKFTLIDPYIILNWWIVI